MIKVDNVTYTFKRGLLGDFVFYATDGKNKLKLAVVKDESLMGMIMEKVKEEAFKCS